MEALPPIPTPFPQRWREFRIQVLPIIIFIITVGAIIYLWRNYVHTASVVGAVETNAVNIVTTAEGQITELLVNQFETVVQGQPIARISVIGSALMAASLKAIQADNNLMNMRMELDRHRNLNALVQMRLQLHQERNALQAARAQLKQAEAELARVQKMFNDPDRIVSESDLDVATRDRDTALAEVTNRANLLDELEQALKLLEQQKMGDKSAVEPIVEEITQAQQEELRALNQPTILTAPMDGVVSTIYKRTGEKVIEGDVIATISSPKADKIIGYIRQPFDKFPTTNDTVTISTRTQRRRVGTGQILSVGPQMEFINPLLLSPDATKIEMGLPFLVSMPEDMRLIPGEFVDLEIQYNE